MYIFLRFFHNLVMGKVLGVINGGTQVYRKVRNKIFEHTFLTSLNLGIFLKASLKEAFEIRGPYYSRPKYLRVTVSLF